MAGKPVHLEIPAKNTSRAQEFYKDFFGWEFQAMEGPDPQPVPGMGWFVTGADTEGNPIGLWQTDPSATMAEAG